MPISQPIPSWIPSASPRPAGMPYRISYTLLPEHEDFDVNLMKQHAYGVVESATCRVAFSGRVAIEIRVSEAASATILTACLSLVPWLVMAASELREVSMISVNGELCFLSGQAQMLAQDLFGAGVTPFACLDAHEEAVYGGFMQRAGVPPPIDVSLESLEGLLGGPGGASV